LLSELTPKQKDNLADAFRTRWSFFSRDDQRPPDGDWRTWLMLGGRGAGKTRGGAEWVRAQTELVPRIALVAPTAADVRDVMIEGESGLLNIYPKHQRPEYQPSKRRVKFHNGAIAHCYSADAPERLRGPQHGAAWCDELGAWRYAQESWDMLMFGLRMGDDPRCVVTTTPRPSKTLKSIISSPHTVITRATTFANRANLAKPFLEAILERYEGTRLGRQELYAEMLEDNPDALWKRARIDELRVSVAPELVRVVVGVDPSATAGGDEAGIIAAGTGADGHLYVLGDYSLQGSPAAWAKAAVRCYNAHNADRIIFESNQGGDMVAHVLRTESATVPLKGVHASRGKQTRAEPIAALYEQGKVHHVGCFAKLEDEMCEWTPGDSDSPNRMDALVWALTELRGRRSVEAKIL
jgi:phage terminase large subunit-like protein